jgi:aminoglycoside phosphotransferase (APT) family kinase protein
MKIIDQDIDRISNNLTAYLKNELKNDELEICAALTRLQGGYETSTYRFKLKGVGAELSKFLVLRLYPRYYGTQNAIWESTVQNALAEEGFPVAKAHMVCTDMSLLGGAFFIMDHIPGQLLMYAVPETVPVLLGTSHAELHNIDPKPLLNKLQEQGIDPYQFSLNGRNESLKEKTIQMPWLSNSIEWLIENQPAESRQLSVCHGDFHALNILVQDQKVTGVLDWPGFAIADPVFDVANTLVLTTIPAKHLTASIEGFSSVDWDLVAEAYLSAYQTRKQLDHVNLDYFRIRRCVLALIQGTEGQKVWQHPLIVEDLVGYIHKITGIQIEVPV